MGDTFPQEINRSGDTIFSKKRISAKREKYSITQNVLTQCKHS